MRPNLRYAFSTITLFLLLAVSAVWTVPAYADDGTPPTEPPPATVQPVEPPQQDPATVDATPAPTQDNSTTVEATAVPTENSVTPDATAVPTQPEVVSTPASQTDSVSGALAAVPDGTDVVVLNSAGEVQPLASVDAANAIAWVDPVWCPAGVAPQNGASGCTTSYGSLKQLIDALLNGTAGVVPATNGVIWIAAGADASAGNMTLDGSNSNLGTMETFALTLKGGWNGTFGSMVTSSLTPSTFSKSITIINWVGDLTLSDISISGTTTPGLYIASAGNVALTNVNSDSNTGGSNGVQIDNTSGTKNVTVTNGHFNSNGANGLSIISYGTITLKDVTANSNSNRGAFLDNSSAAGKSVTLTGTNVFNSNSSSGLYILSKGVVTLNNNVTANSNTQYGLYVDNTYAAGAMAVTLTGVNIFNTNTSYGLAVYSHGQITVNDLTANGSTTTGGAYLENDYTGFASGVKLTGTNQFDSNHGIGLGINSFGAILTNNLIATNNFGTGVNIQNSNAPSAQPVTLSGSNQFEFNVNNGYGLTISSNGAITVNNAVANNNASYNAYITGGAGKITFTGTNQFNSSTTAAGIYIYTKGAVAMNSVTATGNTAGSGLYIDNASNSLSPMSVTLSGTNVFSDNNNAGLYISASGAITLSNITANNITSDDGVYLTNQWDVNLPSPITLSGTNTFNNNYKRGLYLLTYGTVTASNLNANLNGQSASAYYGKGVYISNSSAAVTPFSVTISGSNWFNGNYGDNLYVQSDGAIMVNSLTSTGSLHGYGASLANDNNGSTGGGVTLSGTNLLTGNYYDNLNIDSRGSISVNSLTASNSVNGNGATLNANGVNIARSVSLTGANFFNNNYYTGLSVSSTGAVTLNAITANSNGLVPTSGYGVYVDNTNLPMSPTAVTLTGTNTFNGDFGYGLYITSAGNIVVNNVTANNSLNSPGVYLNNASYPGYHGITVAGFNSFSGNHNDNLDVYTSGPVSVSNITSTSAGYYGLSISNNVTKSKPQPVTLSGVNSFTLNGYNGLYIISYGAITLANVTASGNGTVSSYSGAYIDNYDYGNSILANPVTFTGSNFFNSNSDRGLEVYSLGNITINSVTANSNTNKGIYLSNSYNGYSGNVTLSGTNSFNANGSDQLWVYTNGAILLNSVTAIGSVSGYGANLASSNNIVPKSVTLTGTNVFSSNQNAGLNIYTYGAITISNVTASSNNSDGVYLDNSGSSGVANVTLNGSNFMSGNAGTNLYVVSTGTITVNQVVTSGATSGYGAYLNNAYGSGLGKVVLTGTNSFAGNGNTGLAVSSLGSVTLSNLTATSNGGYGVSVSNSGAATSFVTISGTNLFSNNTSYGLQVTTWGVITTNNLTATGNGSNGVSLANSGGSAPSNVVMNGTNFFNSNNSNGLYVTSRGNITLNHATANNSTAGGGVSLDNSAGAATVSITLTGVNLFVGNQGIGLYLNSGGTVNLTKVTADANLAEGTYIHANGNIKLVCGSFTNNASYGVRFSSFNSPFVATLQGVVLAGNNGGGAQTFITGTGSIVNVIGCPIP